MYHRYRLGHQWVPEMVLNVQSAFFSFITAQGLKLFITINKARAALATWVATGVVRHGYK